MSKDMYKLFGRYIPEGAKPSIGFREYEDLTYLVGSVKTVDAGKWIMTVELFDKKGQLVSVPISQPYAGNSSYIAAMPEEGSIVVLGNQRNFVWPIAYIPNYHAALDQKILKVWPSSVNKQEQNVFQYRMKKLEQGELNFASSKGTEVFIGKNLTLEGGFNSIKVDPVSDSIINSALNNYTFSNGVWQNAGVVYRNSLSKEIPFASRYLKGDKVAYILRPSKSSDFGYNFTEYLLEVEDEALPIPQINDVTSDKNITYRNPVAIFSMGNFVGNDEQNKNTYAKILGINLFKDVNDDDGGISFRALTGDDYRTKGIAICWLKPDRRNPEKGAFFGVDKEGHFYQYIPTATAGGIGKGRSMSIVAIGNKKEIWGPEARYGNAWDMVLKGGMRWVIGRHNDRDGNPYLGRSIDVRSSSSAYYHYGTRGDEKVYDFVNETQELTNTTRYKKIEKIEGYERKEVASARETAIGGSDRLRVDGMKEESIGGAFSISVGTDMNLGVTSTYTETVDAEKSETYGSRKTVLNLGGSSTTVRSPLGNITETILFAGSKRTTVNVGNIDDLIILGNRTFTTVTGSINASAVTGNIGLSTAIGNIAIRAGVGKVDIQATQSINITTLPASNVNVIGGKINLIGRTLVPQGVVTGVPGVPLIPGGPSHYDYITGAPLIGSGSVGATS